MQEVTITIYDRLQYHDQTDPTPIFAVNLDQPHLILQCLTDLEIQTRAKIYPTTRGSQPPITVTSQR